MAAGIVLQNVLLMLAYMLGGYILTKCKLTASDHAKTVSGILIYLCSPCLQLSSWQSMAYSKENFGKMMLFFAVSFAVQVLFFALLYLIFRKKFDRARYRILTVGGTLGNVGFFGLPIVLALFPDQPIVTCYSTLFVLSMNMLAFTIGVFAITRDKKYISLKEAVVNPVALTAVGAVILYLLRIKLPIVVGDAVTLLGRMTTPMCMFVLGLRLASMDVLELFRRPFSYAVTALKLIVCPLFAYLCVAFLPFADDVFKATIFILSATPSAAVVLGFAELHECERKLSANVLLLTTICCVVTLPLLSLLVM